MDSQGGFFISQIKPISDRIWTKLLHACLLYTSPPPKLFLPLTLRIWYTEQITGFSGGADMNDMQRRTAAKRFAEYWKDKGYEKGESQKFWLSLLADLFGVEHPAEYMTFEEQVQLGHTSFIAVSYTHLEQAASLL